MPRTVLIALFLTGLLAAHAAPQDVLTRFKIDSHYHYRDSEEWLKQTIETYRKYNSMVVVFTPFEALEKMKQAAADYPDVFIPYGRIQLDDPEALSKIDAYHLAGFKGIGETSGALHGYDAECYFPIYERIQYYGMAVNFHVGIVARRNPEVPRNRAGSIDRMRPHLLDTIARSFPKMTIHGSHLGNPEYEVAAETLRWNFNLFYDITGSSLLKKDKNPEFWGEILWWRPSLETRHSPSAGDHAFGKILFGTDEGPAGLLPNIERFQKFLDVNDVPENVRKMCWGGTLARVLGIQPRPDR
jgi:predicted TIM-barrel fold metal-dependent hydrolase